MKYFIEDVKFGITDGGIACGPVDGSVVVSVKYNDGTTSKWINNVECMGIPNFYLTEEDIFDELVKEDFENLEFMEYLKKHFAYDFNGISLCDYDDMFNSFEGADPNTIEFLRAVIWITRCDFEETDSVISYLKGKSIENVDIPTLDIEEDYIEQSDEEFDEEEEE